MANDSEKVVTLNAIAEKVRSGDDSSKFDQDNASEDDDDHEDPGRGDSSVGLATQEKYPASAPVTPLGRKDAEFHFLDAMGTHRILTAGKFDQAHIEDLFSPRTSLLAKYWPHTNKDGIRTGGWVAKSARVSLFNACSRQGFFDPAKRLRGLGAWIDDDGNLVYHGGTHLIVGGKKVKPGYVGGYLYPKRQQGLMPGNASELANACDLILSILRTFNFERGEDAVRLVFGHMVTQLIGGALDFRPAIYLTGDEGSGKTTLLKLFEAFSGMLMASDSTPAGIYQTVRDNAIAVGLDENEPDMPVKKQKALLSLMRISASGGMFLRGSGEHKSVEFTARSPFVFSSITPIQMGRADLSRMPMIEIGQATGKLPDYTTAEIREAGKSILAHLLGNWNGFIERIALWSDEMREAGHDPRGIDAYGTLIAASDFVQFAEPMDKADRAEEVERYKVTSLDDAGGEKQGDLCLQAILGYRAPLDGEARRYMISEMIRQIWEEDTRNADEVEVLEQPKRHKRFDRTLRQHGLAVLTRSTREGEAGQYKSILKVHPAYREGCYLVIAHRSIGLNDAVRDTPWQTEASSAMSGWTPTLKRLVGHPFEAAASGLVSFSGKPQRGVRLKVDHLFSEADI